MHLQRHSRLQVTFENRCVDANHCQFDQIGGVALEWSIDRGALCESAQVVVFAVDIRDGANAAEERLHAAVATRLLQSAINEGSHASVLLEVRVNKLLGFGRFDSKILREPKWREAIHDSEVHNLGLTAMVR